MSDIAQCTPAEVPSGPAASCDSPVRHPYFCMESEMVAVQVENILFNVHKQQLCRSETFREMFGIKEPSMVTQGSSLDNPIKLLGISAQSFESLLTVLYAHSCPTCTHALQVVEARPFDSRHIASAFRLADMWNFTDLRGYLTELAAEKLDAVSRAVFAREFSLDDLLEQAYLDLCQRDEPLTAEETSKLGYESSSLVSRLREECCRRFLQNASILQRATDDNYQHIFSLSQDRARRKRHTLTVLPAGRALLPCSEEAKNFLVDEIKEFVEQWIGRAK
ncbi:hypothetical protein FRC07_013176 [Ceratobasidium sp. 392]|nr:hypothetical protein FRC07_013176 [Ceratobasidium sp. 392]